MIGEDKPKPCQPNARIHNFHDGADVCQCGRMRQRAGHVELQAVDVVDMIDMARVQRFVGEYMDDLSATINAPRSSDKINPSHYDGDAYMHAIAMLDYHRPFCLGQAIKYLWRAGRKQGESAVDDVGKARWYLDWLRGAQGDAAKTDLVRLMLETACGAALAGELPVERLASLVHMMQHFPEFQP